MLEKDNKIIRLIILFILFIAITYFIKFYFKPFFLIVFIFVITKPVYNLLLKLKIPKQYSAIASIFLVNIILSILIYYFANTLIYKVIYLYENHLDKLDILEETIKQVFHVDFNSLLDKVIYYLTSNIKTGATITGETLISIIISIVTTYFLLVDKNKVIDLFCLLISKKLVDNIRYRIINLKEVIKIEVILVVLCTMITIVGFRILRVPSSIFLGVICGILDILPYVGTIIVFIPIIIYNIIIKEYLIVIGLIALYILSQVLREILELKYLSSKLDIHPLVIMLSIYIGAKILGLIGILVGPIYCLIAKDIIYD